MEQKNAMNEIFGDVIYSYTRKQAIEDGVLVDCTKMAQEAGFKFPVAITSTVWNEYIVPNDELVGCGQSYEGRLWDVLWMLRYYAGLPTATETLKFKLYFVMIINDKPKEVLTELKAICGPGDEGEPVITIMKPEED
ncbi:DUF6573 family protein [Thermodesulfobacteriota bacterium]